MKATTEERWRAHVAAWAKSGLTCKAYAAKVRLHPRTLAGWKSKLGETAAPASFVEVTSQVAARTVKYRLPRHRSLPSNLARASGAQASTLRPIGLGLARPPDFGLGRRRPAGRTYMA